MLEVVRKLRERRERVALLIRETLSGAQPSLTVAQVAGCLTGGPEGPGALGEKSLYAAGEGRRPLWPHDVVRLVEVTGDARLLVWLAGECGYFLVPKPEGGGVPLDRLSVMMQECAKAIDAVLSAQCPEGESGRAISAREMARISKLIDELCSVAQGIRAECSRLVV
jgi:hypothetical protein